MPAAPCSSNDLTCPSGLEADDLQLHYELKGLEQEFIDAEREHGVRADFLAAVAALESGWGRYRFEENNIMGFGGLAFRSEADCIDHVAEFLSENYLDPDGIYYNGTAVEDVCTRYNGREEWAEAVKDIMEDISEKEDTGEDYQTIH